MLAFILRRIAQSIGVVAAMVVIVFFGVNVVGDPVWMMVAPDATQADIDRVRREFGFDQPIFVQFLSFVKGLFTGTLGHSYVHGESAITLILQRLPATMELAFVALFMAIVLGIPLGLYAGLKPDTRLSRGIMAVSILGFSLPTFWVGLMLIMLFAVMLGWLPATGRGDTASLFGWQTSLLT
ncbi:MAG: ABC transporter permease, partial [Beijerinckiaceae bacterium]